MWRIFRHTKGMLYVGIGAALHSESCEPLVVYRTLYDNALSSTWARPKEMFHEEISPGVTRFTEVARVRIAVPEDEAIILSVRGLENSSTRAILDESRRGGDRLKDLARVTYFLLELTNGDVIATVAARRAARRVVELCSLVVKPTHRRRGYGSALARVVMEIFRMEDDAVRFIGILTSKTTLFERLGFCAVPVTQGARASDAIMYPGDSPLSDGERLHLSRLVDG